MPDLAVVEVFSGEAVIETADDLDHGRFPGAVFADQPHNFAATNFEVRVFQSLDRAVVAAYIRELK